MFTGENSIDVNDHIEYHHDCVWYLYDFSYDGLMKYIEKLAPIIASVISDLDDRDICKYFKRLNSTHEYDCNECRLMGTCWKKDVLLKLLLTDVEEDENGSA